MAQRRRMDYLYERLLQRLARSQWSAGESLPPSRWLEREFGVSHVTMLAAVRRLADAGLVDVRQRQPPVVQPGAAKRAEELLAAMTRWPRQRRLAVLLAERFWPPNSELFHTELLRHVTEACARHGQQVDVLRWPYLAQVEFIRELADRRFAVILAVGIRADYLLSLHLMRQQGLPVVLFNCDVPELPLPSINLDEYDAARRLASRLARLGHRDMSMVTWAFDRRLKARRHRVEGWLDALQHHGLLDACIMPVYYVTPRPDILSSFGRLFRHRDHPTAIVFGYGPLCERFISDDRYAAMRVPQELSLATFDAVRPAPAGSCYPPITTVLPDLRRTARCVIDMVERIVAGDACPHAVNVPMKVNLTGSLAPPAALRV